MQIANMKYVILVQFRNSSQANQTLLQILLNMKGPPFYFGRLIDPKSFWLFRTMDDLWKFILKNTRFCKEILGKSLAKTGKTKISKNGNSLQ